MNTSDSDEYQHFDECSECGGDIYDSYDSWESDWDEIEDSDIDC